jgi:CheY-like chemotaxis protein
MLGIDLATIHKPDLILLDINMLHLDGYQVLQFLQNDELLKQIPVIAITANAMPAEIERGKLAGFSEYLTKPLDLQNFIRVVNSYLPAIQ